MGNSSWLHTKELQKGVRGDAGRRGTLPPPSLPPHNSTHPLGPKKMNETKYTIPYTHANPRVCVRKYVCVWMPSCCLAFSPWAWHMRLPT